MRQLVQDRVRTAFVLVVAGRRAENVLVANSHAARVFHRAHVVLGAEDLVVLVERVAHPEVLGVVVKALLGNFKELICIQVFRQGLAAVQRQRHGHFALGGQLATLASSCCRFRGGLWVGSHRARPFVAHHVPWPHAECDQVGGQQVVHRGCVHGLVFFDAMLLRDHVIGHHTPTARGGHGDVIRCLDIWLVKACKYPLGIGSLKLGVHVHLTVRWVGKAVQALARGGVRAIGADDQLMLAFRQVFKQDAAGGVEYRINTGNGSFGDVLTIQDHAVNLRGTQVNDSGTCLGVKADGGVGSKRGGGRFATAAEIQIDGVVHVADQLRSLCGLMAIQVC